MIAALICGFMQCDARACCAGIFFCMASDCVMGASKNLEIRSVFLFSFFSRKGKLPVFRLGNPQAFSNSRFLEVPL